MENGVKSGYGKYKFHDGKEYVGDFVNNQLDGFGTMDYPEGYYEGYWKNNQRNGKGIMKFFKGDYAGDEYEGYWKDDEEHGKGKKHMRMVVIMMGNGVMGHIMDMEF